MSYTVPSQMCFCVRHLLLLTIASCARLENISRRAAAENLPLQDDVQATWHNSHIQSVAWRQQQQHTCGVAVH